MLKCICQTSRFAQANISSFFLLLFFFLDGPAHEQDGGVGGGGGVHFGLCRLFGEPKCAGFTEAILKDVNSLLFFSEFPQ